MNFKTLRDDLKQKVQTLNVRDFGNIAKNTLDYAISMKQARVGGAFTIVGFGVQLANDLMENIEFNGDYSRFYKEHNIDTELEAGFGKNLLELVKNNNNVSKHLNSNFAFYKYQNQVIMTHERSHEGSGTYSELDFKYNSQAIKKFIQDLYWSKNDLLSIVVNKAGQLQIDIIDPKKAQLDYSQYKRYFDSKYGVLLWGPPGSGKTSTILSYLKDKKGRSCLITKEAILAVPKTKKWLELLEPEYVVLDDIDHQDLHSSQLIIMLDFLHSNNIRSFSTANKVKGRIDPSLLRPERLGLNLKFLGCGTQEKVEYFLKSADNTKTWNSSILEKYFKNQFLTYDYLNSLVDMSFFFQPSELFQYMKEMPIAEEDIDIDISPKSPKAQDLLNSLLADETRTVLDENGEPELHLTEDEIEELARLDQIDFEDEQDDED